MCLQATIKKEYNNIQVVIQLLQQIPTVLLLVVKRITE